jgi:recombinational DNA repair protein RecR
VDVKTVRTVIWVDVEFFIMLKMEGYNDLGNLESKMVVESLVEFEGKQTPEVLLATNESDESSTTITFVDRHRPESELTDSVFAPESLATFDPSVWGF